MNPARDMNLAVDAATSAGCGRSARMTIGDTPATLATIANPRVSLAIWARATSASFCSYLANLPQDAFPNVRVGLYPERAEAELAALFVTNLPTMIPLITDIAMLARLYGRNARPSRLMVRLARIEDDACSRFHADNIGVRLLCTYRGPGTEYIAPEAVAMDDHRAVVRPCPTEIHRLEPLHIGLFRGLKGRIGRPITHRSPPIAGGGIVRWLLAIDEGHEGC